MVNKPDSVGLQVCPCGLSLNVPEPIPHPDHQQILLALPLKYIKN